MSIIWSHPHKYEQWMVQITNDTLCLNSQHKIRRLPPWLHKDKWEIKLFHCKLHYAHYMLSKHFWRLIVKQGRGGSSKKLLEGEGNANPWLSTLLSLQTSLGFSLAPRCMCFHLNRWQNACEWRALMVSRETQKQTLRDVQGYNAFRPISACRRWVDCNALFYCSSLCLPYGFLWREAGQSEWDDALPRIP